MSIELKNVSYIYMPGTPYEQHALKNINIEINAGEFIGVIGHTGSGKSTLMQHLNGLLAPTSGKVFIEGVDVNTNAPEAKNIRRKVGMVFQYPEHQLFEETIYDDIAFGPRNLGISEEEILERVKWSMAMVGLEYEVYAQRSPFQLSGGQMRRVAIAGVLAMKPSYLILDEPSAGLDPRGRDSILSQIYHYYKQENITVVLVSHNMEEVARLASRIVVMKKGEIMLDGKPKEIFTKYSDELASAGVEVPKATKLLRTIQNRGLNVNIDKITAEEAAQEIYIAMGGIKHAN